MNSIEERYAVRVDGWVIMPNHVHMIVVMQGSRATARVAPTGEAGRQPLGRIIGAYKSLVDHKCRIAGFEGLLWQRNYYEHVIRSEEDLMKIREYIQENPWKWKEDEMYIDNSL